MLALKAAGQRGLVAEQACLVQAPDLGAIVGGQQFGRKLAKKVAQVIHIASSGVVTRFDAGGFSPYQRAMTAGYAVAGDLSIGGLFFELLYSGAGASVAEVVNAWKEDTESLSAMASPDFKDIGVGLASSI